MDKEMERVNSAEVHILDDSRGHKYIVNLFGSLTVGIGLFQGAVFQGMDVYKAALGDQAC
jgi:hypothetical protein